jgi:transposase
MKKRTYSREFKEQTVRLSYQRENLRELAYELGIHVDRIYNWRKDLKESEPLKSKEGRIEDSSELKRLKKELKDKDLELEILKKAVHIFSKSDGKFINL